MSPGRSVGRAWNEAFSTAPSLALSAVPMAASRGPLTSIGGRWTGWGPGRGAAEQGAEYPGLAPRRISFSGLPRLRCRAERNARCHDAPLIRAQARFGFGVLSGAFEQRPSPAAAGICLLRARSPGDSRVGLDLVQRTSLPRNIRCPATRPSSSPARIGPRRSRSRSPWPQAMQLLLARGRTARHCASKVACSSGKHRERLPRFDGVDAAAQWMRLPWA